jgi:hypothetical protein
MGLLPEHSAGRTGGAGSPDWLLALASHDGCVGGADINEDNGL